MRSRVSLIAVAAGIAALMPLLAIAAAAATPATGANIAANVPADQKACINKLFLAQSKKTPSSTQPAGASTDGLKDNCTSETIMIDASGKKTVSQTGRVGNNDLKSGCIADGCSGTSADTCGIVTIKITVSGVTAPPKPISKCDPNYQKDLSAAGSPAGASKAVAIDAINQTAVQAAIQSNNPSSISSALQAYGVPADQAATLTKSNPDDAKSLLSAFASGNSDQINTAVAQASADGVTLNPDTLSKINSLTPQQLSQNLSSQSLLSDAQQTTIKSINDSPSTFAADPTTTPQSSGRGGQYAGLFSSLESQYGLPSGYLTNVCTVESKCTSGVCASSSSACGMFQYTSNPDPNKPGTWQIDSQRYNLAVNGVNAPLDPSLRYDATTAANVTAYTASYYQNTYASTIANSGMDPNAALYSIHNLGAGGGPAFMNAFAQNSSQPVSNIVSPSAIRGNPTLYGDGSISLAQAQQNMLNLMGGSNNANGPVQQGPNVQSPLNAWINTSGSGQQQQIYYVSTGQSPYANVSTLPNNYYSGTNAYTTPGIGSAPAVQYAQQPLQSLPIAPAPVPVSQTPINPINNVPVTPSPQTPITAPSLTPNNPPTVSPGQTGTAVAQIIAQPKSVAVGGLVNVSWSSAGMSAASVCQVSQNGAVIAQANEGTKTVTASSAGTIMFAISCTAQGTAQTVQGSSSVVVQ